jgi:uncharacterized Zn-binding protein involved in type VI secretion
VPQGPAARLGDNVLHPLPPVLTGVPAKVLIGMQPAWKGIPLAAAPGIMATNTSTEATLQALETTAKVAEAAALAAAGTPGAPAAVTAATAARLAAETAKATSAATNSASIAAAAAGGASMHACALPWPLPPHGPGVVIDGSATVMIENCPACRMGDTIIEAIGPPNKIMMGCQTVIIGDSGGGGGGAGAGAPGAAGPGGLAVTTVPHWIGDDDVKVGNAIIIEGSPAFQKKVLDRLEKIGKTPSGKALLARIEKSGKTMTITEFTEDNSDARPEDWVKAGAKGQPVYDGAGKPINSWLGLGPQKVGTGEGSDVNVRLNPELKLPNGKNGPMPNDAVLFHEMTHGVHDMEGTTDCAPVSKFDTKEEQTTISTGTPNEADYLKESGYAYKRADHDTTWVANP